MLPLGFATFLLIPIQVYFKYLHEGFEGGFFPFLKSLLGSVKLLSPLVGRFVST